MTENISLTEARRLGLKRYFNGKPCPRGHVAERLVSNMGCIACAYSRFRDYYLLNIEAQRARAKAWGAVNPERRKQTKAAWEAANKDKKSAWDKRSYAKHRTARLARNTAYREANKERLNAERRQWKKDNLPKVIARVKAREERKRMAIPLWADLVAIERFYIEASALTKATGIKHHVDHYVPLNGRIVCGLHVETNLRIITAAENLKKGDRWQP